MLPAIILKSGPHYPPLTVSPTPERVSLTRGVSHRISKPEPGAECLFTFLMHRSRTGRFQSVKLCAAGWATWFVFRQSYFHCHVQTALGSIRILSSRIWGSTPRMLKPGREADRVPKSRKRGALHSFLL